MGNIVSNKFETGANTKIENNFLVLLKKMHNINDTLNYSSEVKVTGIVNVNTKTPSPNRISVSGKVSVKGNDPIDKATSINVKGNVSVQNNLDMYIDVKPDSNDGNKNASKHGYLMVGPNSNDGNKNASESGNLTVYPHTKVGENTSIKIDGEGTATITSTPTPATPATPTPATPDTPPIKADGKVTITSNPTPATPATPANPATLVDNVVKVTGSTKINIVPYFVETTSFSAPVSASTPATVVKAKGKVTITSKPTPATLVDNVVKVTGSTKINIVPYFVETTSFSAPVSASTPATVVKAKGKVTITSKPTPATPATVVKAKGKVKVSDELQFIEYLKSMFVLLFDDTTSSPININEFTIPIRKKRWGERNKGLSQGMGEMYTYFTKIIVNDNIFKTPRKYVSTYRPIDVDNPSTWINISDKSNYIRENFIDNLETYLNKEKKDNNSEFSPLFYMMGIINIKTIECTSSDSSDSMKKKVVSLSSTLDTDTIIKMFEMKKNNNDNIEYDDVSQILNLHYGFPEKKNEEEYSTRVKIYDGTDGTSFIRAKVYENVSASKLQKLFEAYDNGIYEVLFEDNNNDNTMKLTFYKNQIINKPPIHKNNKVIKISNSWNNSFDTGSNTEKVPNYFDDQYFKIKSHTDKSLIIYKNLKEQYESSERHSIKFTLYDSFEETQDFCKTYSISTKVIPLGKYYVLYLAPFGDFKTNVKAKEIFKINNLTNDIEFDTLKYKLIAITFHHGDNITGGHYTACRKIKDQWWHINDRDVIRLTAEEVSGITKLSSNVTPTYLLYEYIGTEPLINDIDKYNNAFFNAYDPITNYVIDKNTGNHTSKGIHNGDNKCFLSSTLHLLSSSEEFVYLMKHLDKYKTFNAGVIIVPILYKKDDTSDKGIINDDSLRNCIMIDAAGTAFVSGKTDYGGVGSFSKALYFKLELIDKSGVSLKTHALSPINTGAAKINDAESEHIVSLLIHAVGPSQTGKIMTDEDYWIPLENTIKAIGEVLNSYIEKHKILPEKAKFIAIPCISSGLFKPIDLDFYIYYTKYTEYITKYLGKYNLPIHLQIDSDKKDIFDYAVKSIADKNYITIKNRT